MATGSGIDAQLGIATESTFGTRVAASRFWEFTEEDVKLEVDRIDSAGIRPGRKTLHRWHSSAQRVKGGWKMELAPQGLGLWQTNAFGNDTITGLNPYTHTSTAAGAIDGKSFTLQIGRPDTSGTVRVFEYTGCKITDWELGAKAGELAMMQTNVYGINEDTSQSLASASYTANYSPFVFTAGSLTLAAGAVDIISFTLKGDNALETDRHRISSTTPSRSKEPKESGLRNYDGTIECDFENLTAYNRFVNGTEAALVLTFNAGASAQLTITANVRFDGETPDIGGHELAGLNLPYKVLSATSDAAALTFATVNADAAA